MKLLITTSSNSNSLAAYFTDSLKCIPELEIQEAFTFDFEEASSSKWSLTRLRDSILPAALAKKSTKLLLDRVAQTSPDAVVVFKGMYIIPGALRELKTNHLRLINYNPDHPFRFDSTGSGNEYVRKALPYYDLIYTYSPSIFSELQAKIATMVKLLPFGFLKTVYNGNDLKSVRRKNRIGFIGIGDSQRRQEIRSILNAGFHVDVHGSGYESLKKEFTERLTIYPAVFGSSYHSELQSYDVQLNLFRNQNHNAHNMRTFEIPAVGGIQLAPYSDQCAEFFEPDREIFMYRNSDELLAKLDYLLSLTNAQNLEYRHAAREKCLTADYSYACRARQMAEDIKAIH